MSIGGLTQNQHDLLYEILINADEDGLTKLDQKVSRGTLKKLEDLRLVDVATVTVIHWGNSKGLGKDHFAARVTELGHMWFRGEVEAKFYCVLDNAPYQRYGTCKKCKRRHTYDEIKSGRINA
jgi:hypothetical protein